MSDKPEPPYTPKEAAAKARVNIKTLYEGIHNGDNALLRDGKIGDGKAA